MNEKMDWRSWIIILLLSGSAWGFDCPEAPGCSHCQRQVENIYEMDCSTSNDDMIKVEIREKEYVKLICKKAEENWNAFHLGASNSFRGIKTLYFGRCNVPSGDGLRTIADRLLIDKIETLHFNSYTNLSSTLTNDTLRGLNTLKKLILISNNFTYLPENLLQDLGELSWLHLQDNNVHHIPKNFFLGTPKLELLEMSTNKLETIDSNTFSNVPKLRFLALWDNKVSKILPNAFDGLPALGTLSLHHNKLESLPEGLFDRLENLTIVNLSQNNFTMDSIPKALFANRNKLQSVVFMENARNMTTLPNGFFANLTKLQTIMLRKIGLVTLPEDLLWGSTSLQNLSMEKNYLSTLPSKIFKDNPELFSINLQFNELSDLPDDVFTDLRKLVKIDLSKNHLTHISEKLFSGLTSLRELNMERNSLVNIEFFAFNSLEKLRIAKFSHNSLTLRSSYGVHDSPFRSSLDLQELHLDHNNVSEVFEDWKYILTKLRVLDLSHNEFTALTDQDFQFLSEKLKVDLSNNKIRHVFLESVEVWAADWTYPRDMIISIKNNPIDCDCKLYDLLRYLEGRMHPYVQNAFHLEVDNLKCQGPTDYEDIPITHLKSKTLRCVADQVEYDARCPNRCNCDIRPEDKAFIVNCSNAGLKEAPESIDVPVGYFVELILSNNSIKSIPDFRQTGYDKVTLLDLDRNRISRIGDTLFQPAYNLTILKLDNNNLTRVDENTLAELIAKLRTLTMSENPWECDCEFFKFIQKSSMLPYLRDLKCKDHDVPIYQMTSDEVCPSNVGWIIGGCLGVAMIGLLIGIVGGAYYRYEREIKVWLYAKKWCLWLVTEDELDKDKLFDAFISYSHKDEDFVVNNLIPNLEAGPRPFKLCVHFRDWLAGEWIPNQIARSVDDSRRTIVVLSPNFLESVWGRMEFRAAHSQALSEGRARVIVILYGEIGPTDDLDPELKAYLSMNTYVKWGDPWFWQKLNYAMPHPPEFTKRKWRKNIYERTQPRIELPNDKSELINGAPATTEISSTPPADSVKIFIVNGVTDNESQKQTVLDTNKINEANSPSIITNNVKKSNDMVNKIQCTTV